MQRLIQAEDGTGRDSARRMRQRQGDGRGARNGADRQANRFFFERRGRAPQYTRKAEIREAQPRETVRIAKDRDGSGTLACLAPPSTHMWGNPSKSLAGWPHPPHMAQQSSGAGGTEEQLTEPAKLLLLASLLEKDRIITKNGKAFLKVQPRATRARLANPTHWMDYHPARGGFSLSLAGGAIGLSLPRPAHGRK